ncbi:MAG: hypothetical protein AAF609_23260 [Cyanobacteria bacterium P01_C01_bin.120]
MSAPTPRTKFASYGFAMFIGVLILVFSLDWRGSNDGWEISPKEDLPWFAVPGLALMGTALGIQIDSELVDRILKR